MDLIKEHFLYIIFITKSRKKKVKYRFECFNSECDGNKGEWFDTRDEVRENWNENQILEDTSQT